MKKCVIFGCGDIGTSVYEKFGQYFDIVAWSDNNQKLWGKTINGITVIPVTELLDFQKETGAIVLLSIMNSSDVLKQLIEEGVENLYIWKDGFFYSSDGLFPLDIEMKPYHCDTSDGCLHILFISSCAYIRDNKMANAVKKSGNKVYHAYLMRSPRQMNSDYKDIYDEIFPVTSLNALFDFVQNSNFDVIHSSSNPEYITSILINSNKPVIHDCHDLRSLYRPLTPNQLCIERLSHKYADGVIYPTAGLRDKAVRMFDMEVDKTLVVENYISGECLSNEKKEKKCSKDGMLHCVYEGGIELNPLNHKYFVDIWSKIVSDHVHIHFYSQDSNETKEIMTAIHPNIHFEGNKSSKELSTELSKYDVGLCVFNTEIRNRNRLYYESSSPNKVYEYVNCGIPIAVGGVNGLIKLVENNGFGGELKLDGDIEGQLKRIAQIHVPDNALSKKGFVFENYGEALIDFYHRAIRNKGTA